MIHHRQIQTPLLNPSNPQITMLQSSHGTPPVPSPARVGLSSNPQIPSPSLSQNPNPNPNPNPNNSNLILKPSSTSSSSIPPQQQQLLQPSSSSSTALLSLLPPLPRAQSLLLQMASLASKLFEVSPNRSLWSTSYRGSLPSFLPGSHSHPLSSLDPRHPSPPSSTKEVLSLFHSLQTHLFESVADLQEILDLQDSQNKLARDVRAKDSALLSFAKKIKESELLLDRIVDDYADYRDRDLLHPNLDLNEVLAYAHKISYTTFAPPEHAAGLAPLRGALPPAPQDNEMRVSQLYHFADLDVGVPKKAAAAAVGDGKEGAADAMVNDVLMEPTLPREEVPVILPSMLPIAVPPGWKRGMPVPVELLSDLPPLPPGWKPGDPVPLPPLEGVLVGIKEEPPRPPAVQKVPEAIQVQHVELDIYQSSSGSDSDGESMDDD